MGGGMRFRHFVAAAVSLGNLLFFAVTVSAQLRAVTYVSGLSLPVAFVQDPGDATIQYVLQQGGRIRLIRSGVLQTAPFLDLTSSISSGGERGLLGMALPADYASSGRFFVNFTNTNGDTVIARFRRSASNTLLADASSRVDLLWSTGERVIRQPYSNHNGGSIVFGPDGYLYIGMGDGGSGNDPEHRAQNLASLLGKMLRIDVSVPDSNTAGFAVPPDNPFRGSGAPEIWSIGLRNPWKFSFDDPARGGTGALVIADVGQGAWEEILWGSVGYRVDLRHAVPRQRIQPRRLFTPGGHVGSRRLRAQLGQRHLRRGAIDSDHCSLIKTRRAGDSSFLQEDRRSGVIPFSFSRKKNKNSPDLLFSCFAFSV
jgi:hypothetical protein